MDLLNKFIDGRTDLVFNLLETGFRPDDKDREGTPLTRWCAYYGDVSALRFMVKNGASLEDLGENYDLNGAAFHGHWQLCQYLLEQGADANHLNPDNGESILHSALCAANNPVSNLIVKLLLAYGADPNVSTYENKETNGFMRDVRTKKETPLHRAAAFGNEETIELLLNADADKSSKDMYGDTPLTWASWHHRPGKILALLTYGQHKIHTTHIQNMQSDHGARWGSGTSIMRMGSLHLDRKI